MSFEGWWQRDALKLNLIRDGLESVAHTTNMSDRCRLLSRFWAKTAYESQESKIQELEARNKELEKKLKIAVEALENIQFHISVFDKGDEITIANEALSKIKSEGI